MRYPDPEIFHMLPFRTLVLYGVPALCTCFTEKTAVNAGWGQSKENPNFSYHFREEKCARNIMLLAINVPNRGKKSKNLDIIK